METILAYNIKVARNVKISYIKQQTNNENIKNTKNIYAMSKKSCPQSVVGLTNMPKICQKVSPPSTFILLHGIGQTRS